MLLLTSTTHALELVTSSTSAVDYHVSFVDITTSAFTPDSLQGAITTATTTTICSAPGASTQRQIKMISIANKGTAAQTITLQKDVSGTNYEIIPSVTLSADERIEYVDGQGFSVTDAYGRKKQQIPLAVGNTGRAAEFYKVGATSEAAGVRVSYHAASGNPGAFAPGTPGLAGRTTDGTTTTDAGCIPIWTPTGSLYLTGFDCAAGVVCQLTLQDWLWINTGATVTTTTAQTVNSVTLPARDLNGSTNGEGIYAAILVTTATTNAGAITNMTLSYTNSDGTAGRTATMASFPATAVAGTFVPFQLAAGDRGIRSIQTHTLGTSLVTGAVSLVMYRTVAAAAITAANVGSVGSLRLNASQPGVRLYNGSCLIPVTLPSATTANNITGVVTITER